MTFVNCRCHLRLAAPQSMSGKSYYLASMDSPSPAKRSADTHDQLIIMWLHGRSPETQRALWGLPPVRSVFLRVAPIM